MRELDAGFVDEICENVEQGEWPLRCAVRLGAARASACRWVRVGGELQVEGNVQTTHQELCLALAVGVEAAEARCERRWMDECEAAVQKCIADGKGSGWTGKMTMLERRFPDRWKKQTGSPDRHQRPEDAFAQLQAELSAK